MSLSSGPNVVDVYLMGSSGGLPSGILESFVLTGALSSAPSLVTIDSVMHSILDAGVQYWLVAAGGASTTAFWQQNVHNVRGPNVSGGSLASLVLDSDTNVIEAYQINGDAVVPEPQSWMLMVAGAIGLMWRGRRTPRPRSQRSANDGADAG
jgi:PEP-CTERM motif